MLPDTKHFPSEVDAQYRRIFAAVQWPAARPGFMVVVGEKRDDRVLGKPVLVLLDEATDHRLWELVRMCAAFQMYYRPERFWADVEDVAAMQFAAEVSLSLTHSLLCVMDRPFAYAFPVLRRMMELRRLVVPADSELNGELLTAPAMEDLGTLKLADYPAIAALSYAVLAMESTPSEPMIRPYYAKRKGRIL